MRVVGLTGGICCGKSTVASCAASVSQDVRVLDADKLGHEAYLKDTSCYSRLLEHFGEGIKGEDGEINRRALGSIVFGDKVKMKELEAIVWPEIRRLLEARILELREGGECKVVVVEAAIMIEAGWQDMCDALWVVVVDRQLAVDRLTKRNSLSCEDAERRIDAQISNDVRTALATKVIRNEGTDKDLEAQVAQLVSEELELSLKRET